jgi:hypothetical protein
MIPIGQEVATRYRHRSPRATVLLACDLTARLVHTAYVSGALFPVAQNFSAMISDGLTPTEKNHVIHAAGLVYPALATMYPEGLELTLEIVKYERAAGTDYEEEAIALALFQWFEDNLELKISEPDISYDESNIRYRVAYGEHAEDFTVRAIRGGGRSPADVVAALWDRLDARDWAIVETLISPTVVLELPASGQVLRGRSAFMDFWRNRPGGWSVEVHRMIVEREFVATEVRLSDGADVMSWWTIFEGQINSGREFWIDLDANSALISEDSRIDY